MSRSITERDKLFQHLWRNAYSTRYKAQQAGDTERAERAHNVILACLRKAKWNKWAGE